jgi:DNA-binding XRE family transcriptional regulator
MTSTAWGLTGDDVNLMNQPLTESPALAGLPVPRQELQLGDRTFVVVAKEDFERLARRAGSSAPPPAAEESFGPDLRRRRRLAGLTQAEVATRAGIRQETLSRLENGRGNPTLRTVRAILRSLGEPD